MISIATHCQPTKRDRAEDIFLEHLTSIKNDRVRDAIRLQTSRGRKRQQRMIIFGWREVERAARCGVDIVSAFLLIESIKQTTQEQLFGLLGKDRCSTVSEAVFEKLSYGDRCDGIIAIAKRPSCELKDFPNGQATSQSGPLIVLEAIEKPGNIGAVFRSADASGASGIILADSGSDAFHPNAIRNSMGTVFSLPHARVTSQLAIDWLRENEYRVFVAMPENAGNAFKYDLTGKCAIVLGNEAQGVSRIWQQAGFDRICLPMLGIADSLNVAATATTLMYESLRQRSTGNSQLS